MALKDDPVFSKTFTMNTQVKKKRTLIQRIVVAYRKFTRNPRYKFWVSPSRWNRNIKLAIENLQEWIDTNASEHYSEEEFIQSLD